MAVKTIIKRVFYWLATPLRRANHRKYADPEADALTRRELPNEVFLPVVSSYVAKGESAIIWVKGYSMRPFLEHMRDKVELSPCTDVMVGDAVLAEYAPGHFVLHRIIAKEGKKLTLRGDGNLQGVEHCTTEDVRAIVTKYIRPGGHVLRNDDPKLIINIKRWGKLPVWVRRVFLFLYRQTI